MQYPILQLKPKRDKAILQRHPWIFSGALAKPVKAEEGDIVEVQSADGKILGYGFFSSKSQISCRMFEWNDNEIAPDFETVDYWQNKLQKAYNLRKSQVISHETNTYRLIHAEGDFLPGLIIDIYANVAVAQILIKGIEKRKAFLAEALYALGFQNVFVKAKSSSHVLEDIEAQSGWLNGEAISPLEVVENGLRFEVDFIEGQKTGFFIDQRVNRELLRTFSQGKKVLNTFSYTGGFSIYALQGGATEVHSVDISADALRVCDRNVGLNFPGIQNHKSIAADCFNFLKDMPENEYDIIVLDPPAFAKHARAVDNASRGYKQINLQAFRRIKPGGLLFTFSCSQNISSDLFQKIVFGAAADSHRNVRIIHQLHQPADHPINIYHPEGEYLKGLVLWVE
ncbi:MAG: class I SAM-dependent rRNA methyltransferase [Sphingobacteriales bacterium]|nr:MAG: class I SAM-dependent rRNA methyltransferase [Sphingobacteriales bacterium]